jgi:hypothetical protein
MRRREVLGALVASGVMIRGFPAAAAPGGRVIVSKLALVAGRVVMGLTIDGAGPFLFMIDTGGHLSLIDEALAHALKLPPQGMTNALGVGGAATLPVFLARNVVFGGGAVQSYVAFAGMDRGFTGAVRGTLAAGMMTAVESDLDFEKGEWRAYPDGRPERVGFIRLADAIVGGDRPQSGSPRLYGEAEVDGRRFRFLLDTGAPGGVSLGMAAARRLGLWDDARPYAPQQTRGIGGVGGIGRLVRVRSLSFGGRTIERPLVLLRARSDRPGDDDDGILGLEVLRHFNLSTEPRTRSFWVKPYGEFAPEERYGMSGLWIDAARDGARVAAVGTGSPAAAAGVTVGDRLVGEPFADLVRKISGRPGTTVTMNVVRNGAAPRSITFTLTPYL